MSGSWQKKKSFGLINGKKVLQQISDQKLLLVHAAIQIDLQRIHFVFIVCVPFAA
jgi:hypothetical protein